ncbi:MAG TPA: neutral/alkaline non-lysosomal ceramidase N-terminal domain-containing protein, partial [Polyangiaceae bacterium]|nr:neutral/alkaline non-lysosomal ceramidase N-terminal domain-containing protein [Polyangiaceae bacterium]
WTKTPVINSRYADVHLPGETVKSPSSKSRATMDKAGQLGIASTRGSLANPSAMLFLMPQTIETFNYDRKRKRPLQTPKQFMPFAKGVAKTVPLALLQLDHTFLSFVPGEITLTVGQMINQAVLQSVESKAKPKVPGQKKSDTPSDAVIVGLANGYMNYVTTPQEYALQAYHGSSTVYGVQSAHFLTYSFECLAQHLSQDDADCQIPGVIGEATEFGYTTGPERERFWREKWDRHTSVAPELNDISACRLENTDPPVLCFRWEDEGPYSVSLRDWLVRVQAKALDASTDFETLVVDTTPFQGPEPRKPDPLARSPVDDRGTAFLTQVLFRRQGSWRWSTLFSPSAEVWKQMKDQDYRFEINQGAGKAPLHSPSLRNISACTAKMINESCTTDP